MDLSGLEILCGGPIKSLFSKTREFDPGMRELVLRAVEALRDRGAVVNSAHIAEGFGVPDLTSQAITVRDLSWCDSCDVYVALWPTGPDGLPYLSSGTAIELGWVASLGKPIVLAWDEQRASSYSHLQRGLDAVTAVEFADLRRVAQDAGVLADAVARVKAKGVPRAHSGAR
ncbi:nucleoside 2-deoxyribosyltransferase [Glycomyces rhizosphaerae]|uniref:Nucleoside 2-deoxyribosyltransferase n=1 Tax=Glycomyces rhizosphaerae TaxID=2054422 RepID=A0ABV7Q4U9_9ACTN